ncbi:hypothetical protein ACLOJK_020893 [Asimina triloba]
MPKSPPPQKYLSSSPVMGNKGFLLCLISAFTVAILPAFFLSSHANLPSHSSRLSLPNSTLSHPYSLPQSSSLSLSRSARVWPKLELNWRTILATIIGFVGSAFGTVGGVGGGGIFVPMLNLVVGFDTKSAAALSKCLIMGASMSSVWYNVRVPHPCRDVPIIDYDLALVFQPMLMLGITIGVALSVVFPYWLISVLIIVLFLGTSSRSFFKGIEMWKQETVMKMEMEIEEREKQSYANGQVAIDAGYEPLIPRVEKSGWVEADYGATSCLGFVSTSPNLQGKSLVLTERGAATSCEDQSMKLCGAGLLRPIMTRGLSLSCLSTNYTAVCSPLYWVLNILQFPVSLSVFGYGAMKLYCESKKRRMCGNTEAVCEASIGWTGLQLLFCAACGILGGTVGGLLGSGGGFILGPLLLEIGVIPQK